MSDELKFQRRMYLDRTGWWVALCMFAIVVILAVYAVVQRIG
jgi:hypothetical protein